MSDVRYKTVSIVATLILGCWTSNSRTRSSSVLKKEVLDESMVISMVVYHSPLCVSIEVLNYNCNTRYAFSSMQPPKSIPAIWDIHKRMIDFLQDTSLVAKL